MSALAVLAEDPVDVLDPGDAAEVVEAELVEDAHQALAVVMTPARARSLTRQLRKALSLSLDLLAEAFDGRAWDALGHPSWEAYCAAELPELALLARGLPAPERRAAVATLRARGLSTRAIAAPLGLSKGTVHRDVQAAGLHLASVISLDGRTRPASTPSAPTTSTPRHDVPAQVRTKTDQTVELVAAAGDDGLTVHELCAATGWHHGQASATLTRLAQRNRLTAGATRRRAAVAYVLPA